MGGSYENLEIRCFDRAGIPSDFEYRFISKRPSPTFELSKQELCVIVGERIVSIIVIFVDPFLKVVLGSKEVGVKSNRFHR